MSIVNLEVKISKIRIKTYQNCGICLSLRLGRILSNLSVTTPNQNDHEITPNLNLAIGCEENMLKINTRASLVIYQVQSQQKREIIGMVFVLLKEKQSQFRKYKIQQSNDPDSFVELSFSITAIQLKQKENQSMASKSSLADIRELHHALNRGHKKTGSDFSYQEEQKKKSRMSPQDKERQLKNRNSNSHKNAHLKSEECNPFDNDDPSYPILLSKAEQELSKERERTSLLTNLLVIQQQKNNQSESFIKCIITSLENLMTNSTQYEEKQFNLIQKSNKNMGKTKKIHEYQTEPTIKKDIDDYNPIKIETIMKERDQLYHISQQLYDKTKLYKVENENLYKNSRNLQNEMKLYLKQIEDLKFENAELKKNIYELSDKKQNGTDNIHKKYNEIYALNEQLKKDNFEFQRKFKESLKALQQFKRDAWRAQQQVIKKDQQINTLKQELESLKSLSGHHKSEEVGSYQKEDKQCIKQSLQSLKLMSALLVKNSMERQIIMQKLQEKKKDGNKLIKQEMIKVVTDLRKRVENYYLSLENQNKKTISIVQMKKKITQIINITQF